MPICLKIAVILIIFTLSSFNVYGYGLSDWQHETPCGNLIDDNGNGITLHLTKKGQEMSLIKRWYFYKDHIIGISRDNYFIVNESTEQIYQFNNESAWQNAIQQNKLTPPLWTRWYADNWVDFDYLLIAIVLGFIFSIPLALLLLLMLYRAIVIEHFSLKEMNTAILLMLILVFGLIAILDAFPQSI